jgi:hypothetical protein
MKNKWLEHVKNLLHGKVFGNYYAHQALTVMAKGDKLVRL